MCCICRFVVANLKKMKDKIKQLIQKDRLSEGIELLLEVITEDEVVNTLTMLKARYSSNQSTWILGILSHENYELENNKIRHALLKTIDEIDFSKQGEKVIKDDEEIIKILFAGNSPKGTSDLMLEKEYIQIRTSTKKYRNTFRTEEIFNFNINSFFDEIKTIKPTVVHLTGHSNREGLVFLDSKNKSLEVIPWKYLAPAIRLFPNSTNCIFINAIYSEEFGQEISQFFPNVICMKGFVPNFDAIRFSNGFYSSLTINKNYQKAYETGMNLISESMKNSYKLPFNGIHYDNSIEVIEKLGTYHYYKNGVLQKRKLATTKHTR